MRDFVKQILTDKTGRYSLRELVIALCMVLIIASWIAQLVFATVTPDYMFYAIVSLVAAGCFGYSIEKPGLSSSINKFKKTRF